MIIRYLVTGILLFALTGKAQQFTLTGHIKGFKGRYVYLLSTYDSKVDSALVKKGRFTFRGSTGELPVRAILYGKDAADDATLRFYLENKKMHVSGNAETLKYAKVSGSQAHADFELFNEWIRKEAEQLKDISAKMGSADSVQALALSVESARAAKAYRQRTFDFIRRYPQSVVSLDQLYYRTNYNNRHTAADYRACASLLDSLAPALKNADRGKEIAERAKVLMRSMPGAMATDFRQPDLNGKEVSLFDYKGHYVLVDFWASWCPGCRQDNPRLVKIYERFRDKGLVILGVSLDMEGKGDAWKEAVKKDGLPWVNVSELNGYKNTAARLYGIQGIPANMLLAPDGTILARDIFRDELEEKLSSLLP
jgi:peroxiredoxin